MTMACTCYQAIEIMDNPFVKEIDRRLETVGISRELVYESYSHKNFGNAEALYELGNLRLRFLRDRDDGSVSVGSSSRCDRMYCFDSIAVWRGWASIDDLQKHYTWTDFQAPSNGPRFSLDQAIELIIKDLCELHCAFSSDKLDSTEAKLAEIEAKLRLMLEH